MQGLEVGQSKQGRSQVSHGQVLELYDLAQAGP